MTDPFHILVVDDEATNRKLLETILKNVGYIASYAQNGTEAIAAARDTLPDLVLLDVNMPGMDGFETCQRLKQDSQLCHIPIVFVSGVSKIEEKLKGFEVGGVDYIVKPFQSREVLARIETQLALVSARKRLQAQNTQLQAEIDRRTKAEAELKHREQKYRALFEKTNDAVFIIGLDLRHQEVNQQAANLLGHKIDEIVGKPMVDFTVTDEHAEVTARAEQLMSGEVLPVYERTFQRKDGTTFPAEVTVTLITDEEGAPLHYHSVVRDISERKRAEEALQKAHDRLAVLTQIDVELVLSLSIEHVLSLALDAAMRMSAADAGFIALADGEKLRVASLAGPYSPDLMDASIPTEAEVIWQAVNHKEAVLRTDVDFYSQRVTVLPGAQAQFVIPLISSERLIGILNLETSNPERFTSEVFEFLKLIASRAAVAIDNAQLYENQAVLIDELEAFAHTVAHDLKNPVGVMMLSINTLHDYFDQMTAEKRESRLNMLLQSTQKMTNIIDALLLLASVRQMNEVEVQVLDMGQIVEGVVQRLDHMIHEYEADITLPDVWPATLGYAPWVEEVWVNYVSNALKYGGHSNGRKAEVTFGATVEADSVRYWVRDNGHGLTPEEQSRLFTPFTRINQVQVKGHGLGLSIVQRIVAKLGGKVGVDSEAGQGSEFYFTLPTSN